MDTLIAVLVGLDVVFALLGFFQLGLALLPVKGVDQQKAVLTNGAANCAVVCTFLTIAITGCFAGRMFYDALN